MLKYVGALFVSLFALATIALLAYLQGFTSFSFAWVLNFMLMMAVSSLMQTFKPEFKARYFDSKAWEASGKVYRWFGVHAFRKLLVWTGWEKLHKAANPVKKDLNALKQLEYNTRQADFGHLVIFFIVMALTIWVAYQEGIAQSWWLISLNVILNVYPIMVQRYNRPRLQKAIQVYERLSIAPLSAKMNR